MAEQRAIAAAEQRRRDEELEREILAREAAGATQAEILDVIETAAIMAPPVEELPVYVPTPVVAKLVTTSKGAGLTYTYSAKVASLGALVKAAAANPTLLAYLSANQVVLNSIARAQKEQMRIPGVELVKTPGVR